MMIQVTGRARNCGCSVVELLKGSRKQKRFKLDEQVQSMALKLGDEDDYAFFMYL
jgi:hypothetical protein